MIRSSQNVIQDLISYGVDFHKDEMGNWIIPAKEPIHKNEFYSMKMKQEKKLRNIY